MSRVVDSASSNLNDVLMAVGWHRLDALEVRQPRETGMISTQCMIRYRTAMCLKQEFGIRLILQPVRHTPQHRSPSLCIHTAGTVVKTSQTTAMVSDVTVSDPSLAVCSTAFLWQISKSAMNPS